MAEALRMTGFTITEQLPQTLPFTMYAASSPHGAVARVPYLPACLSLGRSSAAVLHRGEEVIRVT